MPQESPATTLVVLGEYSTLCLLVAFQVQEDLPIQTTGMT
jgi:hypothetical protein